MNLCAAVGVVPGLSSEGVAWLQSLTLSSDAFLRPCCSRRGVWASGWGGLVVRFRCAQFSDQPVPCLKVFRSVAEPAAFGDGPETGRIRYVFRSVAGPVAFGDGAEVQFVCFVGPSCFGRFCLGRIWLASCLDRVSRVGSLKHFVQNVNSACWKICMNLHEMQILLCGVETCEDW